jgi:hypothetical protein
VAVSTFAQTTAPAPQYAPASQAPPSTAPTANPQSAPQQPALQTPDTSTAPNTSQPATGPNGTYTIQRTARIVILDVVVTDAKGNVVTDLRKDDFKVTTRRSYRNGHYLRQEGQGTQTHRQEHQG